MTHSLHQLVLINWPATNADMSDKISTELELEWLFLILPWGPKFFEIGKGVFLESMICSESGKLIREV